MGLLMFGFETRTLLAACPTREMFEKRDVYGNAELCLWISWALENTLIPIFRVYKNFPRGIN